ncbi:thioredoxin [Bacteroidota bacterium]
MGKKKTFGQLISKSENPVLVDFHATWCGPCHTMSPIIQKIAEDFSGRIKVIKVDVDKNQAAAMKYSIKGVPTLILYNKGEIIWRQSGVINKNGLINILNHKL